MQHRAETRKAARSRARHCALGTNVAGVSTLEFALVLPVLLAMIMGIIEVGNMYYVNATVSKAAQIGARTAVTGIGEDDGTRLAMVEQAALGLANEVASAGAIEVAVRSWPNLTATGTATEDDAGQPCQMVEVEVRCDYHPITPLIGAILPETIPLSGQQRMINEPWMPCS